MSLQLIATDSIKQPTNILTSAMKYFVLKKTSSIFT